MMTFPWMKARKHLLLGLALPAMMSGCGPADKPAPRAAIAAPAAAPDDGREVEALRAEVARLTAENARLRLTPFALAAEVEAAARRDDATAAGAALKQLVEHFPHSPELTPARKRVEGLVAKLRAAEDQKKKLAALGFKALKVHSTFTHEGTALSVANAYLTRRWTFDSYGDGLGWRYLDAERGQRLLVTRLAVSSTSKDPALFGIGLYQADGATMTLLGNLRYRFSRWQDFGAYLGTHADFRNDFSHSPRIPFSAGVALGDAESLRRPLYLVATREGCHKRHYDRLVQPPVHYIPGDCGSLKKTLTVDDFRDGSLAVLRRID